MTERSTAFSRLPYFSNARYSGYFQSEKYFRHNLEEIQRLFRLSDRTVDACGVHVRRGDYLNAFMCFRFCPSTIMSPRSIAQFVNGMWSDSLSTPTTRPGSVSFYAALPVLPYGAFDSAWSY